MLKYVIYHTKMTGFSGVHPEAWQTFCQNMSQHDVMMKNIDTICSMQNLQAILEAEGIDAKEALLLAITQEEIDESKELSLAAIGIEEEGGPMLSGVPMVLQGLEEVDYTFINRMYERAHGLPWTILTTKRCYLREFSLEDMDALISLYEQKGVTDYMEPLFDREQELEYQKAYIREMYGYYGYGMWLVMEKGTDRLIGRAGIDHHMTDGKMEPELGYVIDPSYQHKGYATEVCTAILDWARDNLSYDTIHCMIEEANRASVALAKRLGFADRGLLTRDEKTYRHYEFHL